MNDSLWARRLANSDKFFDQWQNKFRCQRLEDYYEGFQWKNKFDKPPAINYRPYQINLFYSTIKIKLASLLFQRPNFVITPRPGNSSWDVDFAIRSATLKQDVLNTIIQNPNCHFTDHIKLAVLDSFFRYGLIEVGYAADWSNPQKEIAHLKSWDDPNVAESKDRVVENNEVPLNERFYIKRIPPQRFRIAISESTDLQDHEWCGYYEYFYTRELQKTKGIVWPQGAPTDTQFAADYTSGFVGTDTSESDADTLRRLADGSISKVWHLFDMVSHKRLLYLDGYYDKPLWEGPLERLPIVDIRWDYRCDGWYPIPPCFQWLSPQDEINEAREQTRSYRRRFTRKFQAVKDTVDEEEKEKFSSGPDGIIIEVKQADAISPIENPEMGHTSENALLLAKDDFNIISGTSAEARGQNADRQTATQSRIIDARAQVRESAEQMDFSNFLCRIGRELLACANEKLVDGLWIKMTTNPAEGPLMDMQVNAPVFQYIRSQDLSDGYDFDIEIDIQNATPAAMEQQKQSFITFLTMLTQFPMIAMSPVLIREAAHRVGYRNEQVIHQMQQVAVLSMAAQASQAGASGQQIQQAANGNNAAKTQVAQEASPDVEAIQQQLNQQIQ